MHKKRAALGWTVQACLAHAVEHPVLVRTRCSRIGYPGTRRRTHANLSVPRAAAEGGGVGRFQRAMSNAHGHNVSLSALLSTISVCIKMVKVNALAVDFCPMNASLLQMQVMVRANEVLFRWCYVNCCLVVRQLNNNFPIGLSCLNLVECLLKVCKVHNAVHLCYALLPALHQGRDRL